jgi:hypothetical protein
MESAQPGQKKKPKANAVVEDGVRARIIPKGGTGRHHSKASGGSAPRAGRGARLANLAQMTLTQMVKPSVQMVKPSVKGNRRATGEIP